MLKPKVTGSRLLKDENSYFNKHILAVLFLIVGMSVTAQDFPDRTDAANSKRTAPDNCLVTAKVVRVIPAWKKTSKKICKTPPCILKLRIIKVNAYGSAFPVKLHKDQKIKTIFVYSTKAFDNGKIKLPGLKRGDVFDAAIWAKHKMNSDKPEFVISTYQKRP